MGYFLYLNTQIYHEVYFYNLLPAIPNVVVPLMYCFQIYLIYLLQVVGFGTYALMIQPRCMSTAECENP